MAARNLVEQIRALPNACYAPRSSRSPGLLTMRLMWHASKRHVSKRHQVAPGAQVSKRIVSKRRADLVPPAGGDVDDIARLLARAGKAKASGGQPARCSSAAGGQHHPGVRPPALQR